MFGKKAQPKDEHEQPEISQDEELPISPFTGEPYDPEWLANGKPFCRQYEADPSIISKVKR